MSERVLKVFECTECGDMWNENFGDISFCTNCESTSCVENCRPELCIHEPVENEYGDIEMDQYGVATCIKCFEKIRPTWSLASQKG